MIDEALMSDKNYIENVESVIASAAKQSSFLAATKKAGLLRRLALRNDG
jgi:hypothetical protein